jgi:hypothetical protein
MEEDSRPEYGIDPRGACATMGEVQPETLLQRLFDSRPVFAVDPCRETKGELGKTEREPPPKGRD